jgi:2-polyprenyl-3-methyl-5-hydroxy-6-metoxy-1,4-benzoquinol methylase
MELHDFWQQHYQHVFARGASYLDYSNENVQLQCFAAAVDGSGSVRGKRCLDVGAGRGSFSRMLQALDAGSVCAVDFIPHAIEELRNIAPQIQGRVANADEITMDLFGSPFDLVYAIEVLQYVDFDRTARNLWSLLSPGGRLIGVVPNADNDIIARVTQRFDDHFRAIRATALIDKLSCLPCLSVVRFKGLSFSPDQSVAAYDSTPWTTQLAGSENFNRIAFVAIKAPVTGDRPFLSVRSS